MPGRSWLLGAWPRYQGELAYTHTHTGLREWQVPSVFEVSTRVYTHSSVLRAAGLCGQWYISLAPTDPTCSLRSRSSGAGAWKQASVKANIKHSSVPANKLSPGRETEGESMRSTSRGRSPHGHHHHHHPLHQYLSNKLNILTAERSDKLSVPPFFLTLLR